MFNEMSGNAVIFNAAVLTVAGTLIVFASYMLMRRKFVKEQEAGKVRESELAKRVYESEVLREISEKIGYSLDSRKVVEIICGSLNRLIAYSTVSYLIAENNGKIKFYSSLVEQVDKRFISEIKSRVIAAYCEIKGDAIIELEIEESIAGLIGEDNQNNRVLSYFNLPIIVSGKLVAIINVASTKPHQYDEKTTDVLFKIAKHASLAVSKLSEIMENEKGRLSQAVDSLSDGLLMVDADFKVVLVNQRLCQLLNVSYQATLLDIVHALSGQLDLRTMLEVATDFREEKIKSSEVLIGDKYLQVYATKVIEQKTEKPMGLMVSFHDITDSKSLEKLRSDFMAVMVHELRAPLTTIKSTVELINEDPKLMSGDELKHHLNVVEETSQSMLRLVNDLLDVAKLESGKFEVVCEGGDLAKTIYDTAEVFMPLAEAKNLKLKVQIDEHLPLASFDKMRIKQVLTNLLSNAIKFTDNGQVVIRARSELVNSAPVDILVSVSDTGIGIDSEEAGKLFTKFRQLKGGYKKDGIESTGLGLYITRGVVEAMGGKIWMESAGAGLGTTFYFTVPIANIKDEQDKEIIFSTKRIAQA